MSNPVEPRFKEPELLWTIAAQIYRSSPAITSSGTFYLGIGFYQTDSLCAIEPDGNFIWSHSVGHNMDYKIATSPSVDNSGRIYIGSPTGEVYCLNSDGDMEWKYLAGTMYWTITSSAAIGRNGSIIFGSMNDSLYCLNSDGNLRWVRNVSSIYSTPAIGSDGTIYIGTSWELLALDPTGEQQWIYTADSFLHYSSPAIDQDGTIYVCSYAGTVYAVSSDGDEKWHYSAGMKSRSSPVITQDGQVLITHSSGNPTEGYTGIISSLSRSGELLWSKPLPGGQYEPAVSEAPVVGRDGTIYVGADTTIYALGLDGDVLWNFNVGEKLSNPPALSIDGILYIASYSTLWAFQTDSHGLASSPWPKIYADYLNTSQSK